MLNFATKFVADVRYEQFFSEVLYLLSSHSKEKKWRKRTTDAIRVIKAFILYCTYQLHQFVCCIPEILVENLMQPVELRYEKNDSMIYFTGILTQSTYPTLAHYITFIVTSFWFTYIAVPWYFPVRVVIASMMYSIGKHVVILCSLYSIVDCIFTEPSCTSHFNVIKHCTNLYLCHAIPWLFCLLCLLLSTV